MYDDLSIHFYISHSKLVFCFVERNRINDITHRMRVLDMYWVGNEHELEHEQFYAETNCVALIHPIRLISQPFSG